MRQYYIKNDRSGDHFAVGSNTQTNQVLLQVQENGEQVRIPLTLEQTLFLIETLSKHAAKITPE